MHAIDFFKKATDVELAPVIVLVGNQRQFKQNTLEQIQNLVFGEDANSQQISRYQSKQTDLTSIRDELATISMWGGDRVVFVEDAGPFVTEYRAGLEKYCQKPARNSYLILDVNTWPKNTKLAKLTHKMGLVLDCSALTGRALENWLIDYAKQSQGKKLSRSAAQLLSELSENDIGLLEQEITKLSSYVGASADISPEDVQTLVGGWKAETTWTMTNAIRDDHLSVALECLQKLLDAGEAPQKILGGINFVFNKFAAAAEIARQGSPLREALRNAGVFPRDIEVAANYMRRIGRPNAEKLYSRLQQTDLNLKGASRVSERLQLETLLVKLAAKT